MTPKYISPAICHDDKPHYVAGLCKNCYERMHLKYNPARKASVSRAAEKYRQNNRQKLSERAQNYREQNRDKYLANKRARRVWNQFRLTVSQYELIRELPCFICGASGSVVDHCHATNTVRGALCESCNRAEGHTKHFPEGMFPLMDQYRKTHDYRIKEIIDNESK